MSSACSSGAVLEYMRTPKKTRKRLTGYPDGRGIDMKTDEYIAAKSIEATPANERTLLSQYFVIYPTDTPKQALLMMMQMVSMLYPLKTLRNACCFTDNATKFKIDPKRYN
eukprot:jgi/Picre1/33397/NNA_008721.t1